MNMKEICKELTNEIDSRTLSVIDKLNKSLENPTDNELRVNAIVDLAINIKANSKQITLLDQIIKDNKESEYINFFQKQRNVYWLKKIKKYYTVTNEELLSMGTEHGFIMRRGEE